MRRRQFITLVSAAAWPFAARAQQRAMPVVGFLSSRSPDESDSAVSAFRHGLSQTGYSEGKNVTIVYRWADGHYDRLPGLAAELVQRRVAVIAATGGEPSPLAAKAATSTIPIVFTAGGDPVEFGLVPSLGSPGGNVTGATFFFASIGPKRLELVRQLRPSASTIAMLINPNYQPGPVEARDVQTGAGSLGVQINVLTASTESEIDAAFANIVQQRADALVIGTDPFLLGQRDQLVRLASRYGIPTIYLRSGRPRRPRITVIYFSEGGDLSDHDVLVRAAAQCGLDAEMVRERLLGNRDIDAVGQEALLVNSLRRAA
jgi:putative tryptophan/tyrosine transport system substrate-binding protein